MTTTKTFHAFFPLVNYFCADYLIPPPYIGMASSILLSTHLRHLQSYFNPRPPKVFLTHTSTQGRGGGGWVNPSTNFWVGTAIEMEFWHWMHMHLRVSQKFFWLHICCIFSYCCHDKLWKQVILFPDFLTLSLKVIIKSLIQQTCKFLLVVSLLIPNIYIS